MRGTATVWAIGLLLPFVALAAEVPVFTASSVLPANAARQELLRPYMLVSIYGHHLGPATGCAAPRMTYPEPPELCGASVTVGGTKSSLLYVQDKQINLRVPYTATAEGPIAFVVTYQGRSSVPVPVRFGPQTARIQLTGPAYVHMPIWIHVDLPEPHTHYLYPITIVPGNFGGHKFEVRRNGILLPPLQPAHPYPMGYEGPRGYGSIGGGVMLGLPHEPKNLSRLPLHLAYRFDKPGLYEVRYLGHDDVEGRGPVLARSSWLRLEVLDFPLSKRDAWLAAMRQSAPADPVELVTDFLPSILALPDNAVLSILKEYLLNSNGLVRDYAQYALYTLYDNPLIK